VHDLEVVVVPDSHPQYVIMQRPAECAAAVAAFLARHPIG
jgi:hypothetical protein